MATTLHDMQAFAQNSIQNHLFPAYNQNYPHSNIASFSTKINTTLHFSSQCFTTLSETIQKIASKIFSVITNIILTCTGIDLEKKCTKFYDTIRPVNPINGKRHFVVLGRKPEKILGDNILSPLVTMGSPKSLEKPDSDSSKNLQQTVNEVVDKLVTANKDLLNPEESEPFNYRADVVIGNTINAFALPAGQMIIFEKFIKELESSIKQNNIKETTIEFQNGSTATVNLEGIELNDVLASLIGHEMTHIASRHSLSAIMRALFLECGPENAMWLYSLFQSRVNEIEADTTGLYFARNADFDARGMLYLLEYLRSLHSEAQQNIMKIFEFFSTHPFTPSRIQANFAAIAKLCPEALEDKVQWQDPENADATKDLKITGSILGTVCDLKNDLMQSVENILFDTENPKTKVDPAPSFIKGIKKINGCLASVFGTTEKGSLEKANDSTPASFPYANSNLSPAMKTMLALRTQFTKGTL